MGGWMDYHRFRSRNGLRADRPLSLALLAPAKVPLVMDLDRMEDDYLDPVYPEPPYAQRDPGSDPTAQCASATGVDVEVVRMVLRYVFRGETPPAHSLPHSHPGSDGESEPGGDRD